MTNGLYGAYRLDGVLAVIYGFHLIMIAALNAVLWVLALQGLQRPAIDGDSAGPGVVFVIRTATAIASP